LLFFWSKTGNCSNTTQPPIAAQLRFEATGEFVAVDDVTDLRFIPTGELPADGGGPSSKLSFTGSTALLFADSNFFVL
jgi:hypothetical protein